jgi:hypothetical protein
VSRVSMEPPILMVSSYIFRNDTLVSFVGDDAEKVNAAVFRAATGQSGSLRKMTQA